MTRPKWKRDFLLGAFSAHEGEWLNRADLAKALSKHELDSGDVNLLKALRREGLIDMDKRQRTKQRPRSYFYRARRVM